MLEPDLIYVNFFLILDTGSVTGSSGLAAGPSG
jgi:hypothetical protein